MEQEGVTTSSSTGEIRISNIVEGDVFLPDEPTRELYCTRDGLQFGDGNISIPYDEIVSTRVDVDKSMTGFTIIGNAFGVSALVMGIIFTQTVLNGGHFMSVPGVGSLLSAILGLYGFFWMRRLEAGERIVLQVDCIDGSQVMFRTPDDGEMFDAIQSRIGK